MRSDRDIRNLAPSFRKKVETRLLDCEAHWLPIFITEWLRTKERQKRLYAQWRTRPWKIVTRTLNSNHLTGFAVDIWFRWKQLYPSNFSKRKRVASIASKHGIHWGYDLWGIDKPHFQDSILESIETVMSFYREIYEKEILPQLGQNRTFKDPELALKKVKDSNNPQEELVYLIACLIGKIDLQK